MLVEADDQNDPIADTVRGIVDGHLVLSRRLAHSGQYPAIDVLASLSRLMAHITTPEHLRQAHLFRDLLATWRDNEELVRLGAWRRGASAQVDRAVDAWPRLRAFMTQSTDHSATPAETQALLAEALG